MEGLDYAVNVKLQQFLNADFDKVMELFEEQVQVWREQRSAAVADRKAQEKDVKKLEAIIARRTDAVEQGQPVGMRLKQRQQELDDLKWRMEQPEPVPSREEFSKLCAPLRPIMGLGEQDPATVRSILRKLGIDRLVVTPVGPLSWKFEGKADFQGILRRRGSAERWSLPPMTIRIKTRRRPCRSSACRRAGMPRRPARGGNDASADARAGSCGRR